MFGSKRKKFLEENCEYPIRYHFSRQASVEVFWTGSNWQIHALRVPRCLWVEDNYLAALHELGHVKTWGENIETLTDGLHRMTKRATVTIVKNEVLAWQWAIKTYEDQGHTLKRREANTIIHCLNSYITGLMPGMKAPQMVYDFGATIKRKATDNA